MMASYARKWLWDRSAFVLASAVVGALILGWFLPGTRDAVMALAFVQIIMAFVVLIHEATSYTQW